MSNRWWFAPEVIQSSALDCGPAALKSLLAGFGVSASYNGLRELCHTGLDGTSIDTIEIVANRFGLAAEQITLPPDHVLIPEANALPAIAIVRLPAGLTHFVVLWRRLGSRVQVMDPATGRRWVESSSLCRDLYRHRMPVPAAAWREWAGSDEFLSVLRVRLKHISAAGEQFIATACADGNWRSLAALDAAVRLAASLAAAGALPHKVNDLLQLLCSKPELIPQQYWTVHPCDPNAEGEEQVLVTGAILVRARALAAPESSDCSPVAGQSHAKPEATPFRLCAELLTRSGAAGLLAAAVAFIATAAVSVFEAILFRSLLGASRYLPRPEYRLAGCFALLSFAAAALALEWAGVSAVTRLGRQLETRLRLAFFRKLPLLADAYLSSRLRSDLAERAHSTFRIRQLPNLIAQCLSPALRLCFTTAGLIWLMPQRWPLLIALPAAALVPVLLAQPLLRERDLKTRTQAGSLMRFYLDSLLGLMPLRATGGAKAIRAEQEHALGEWAQSALALQSAAVIAEGVQSALVLSLVVLLFLSGGLTSLAAGQLLLAVYWALNIPSLARDFGSQIRRLPYYRNLLARLIEPLEATEEPQRSLAPLPHAPRIEFRNLSASIAGNLILNSINLTVEPGEHVAIVGSSGAGKSSLASVLLGWIAPTSGDVLVNGELLHAAQLRASCAWVDPSVQLWNDTLFSNVRYGSSGNPASTLDDTMLRPVLENLPDGWQTNLGEGGGLVSGGEGQRVRFARALMRPDAPLAILDEPFRGLDRDKRRELLIRARRQWASATLFCITHDIQQTRTFDRVVVIEGGQIIESGKPAELAANAASRYAHLISAERQTLAGLWSSKMWRRIWIENGQALEAVASSESEAEVA